MLSDLSDDARELYLYMTTNPEPKAVIERAYRIAERDLQAGKKAALSVEVSLAVGMCVRMYIHSFSTDALSTDALSSIFSFPVRKAVRGVLMSDFKTHIDAGNTWLQK